MGGRVAIPAPLNLENSDDQIRHTPGGEPPFEGGAHATAIVRPDPLNRLDRFGFVVDDEAGDAILDDFRKERDKAITGVPQAIASIMTSPNGSGQSIGKSTAAAPPRKSCFWLLLTSPTKST